MEQSEFEKKLTLIESEELNSNDITMLEESLKINDGTLYMKEEIENEIINETYNGKILVRVPRSLHKELMESAKKEGVSLNQYALYKLSH